MSTWGTATANLITRIEALIGAGSLDYREIPESIDADSNEGKLIMRKAFTVDIGPASKVAASVKLRSIEERAYIVVLFREKIATASNVTAIQTIKKSMLDDSEVLRKGLEADNTLSGEVIDVDWGGDTGVEYVDPENPTHYAIGATILVKIDFK